VSLIKDYYADPPSARETTGYAVRGNQIGNSGALVTERWADGPARWQVTYIGGYGGTYTLPDGVEMVILQLLYRWWDNKGGLAMESAAGWNTTWRDLMRSDIRTQLDMYRLRRLI